MTNLQQHHDRLATIRKSHWREFETSLEHEQRVEAAEETAGRYFDHATAGQKAIYVRAIQDLSGLHAPRYDRAREAANAAWYASTSEARKLFEATLEELMRDGEVSEETSALWDALPDFVDLREVA
jgi:hypothetical protein